MAKYKENFYHFIFENNLEKFVMSSRCPEIVDGINSHDTTNVNSIGTCICTLFNSLDEIKKIRNNIMNTNKNIKYDEIFENVISIYKQLISIDRHFYIAEFDFIDFTASIRSYLQKHKDANISDIYKLRMNLFLKYDIINPIEERICNITSKHIKYASMPRHTISYKFVSETANITQYDYRVNSIYDLISASSYQIAINKLFIKKCKYHNCNKYFVTSRRQTRYCENPCPDDPSQTCRSIRKTIDRSLDIQEEWEIDLDDLEIQLNRIRTRFYDNIKNIHTTQRKREIISNNQQKLKDITHELKRRIKGTTASKRDSYLKIYKNFLNEVEDNLNLSPSVFKIKKPKY